MKIFCCLVYLLCIPEFFKTSLRQDGRVVKALASGASREICVGSSMFISNLIAITIANDSRSHSCQHHSFFDFCFAGLAPRSQTVTASYMRTRRLRTGTYKRQCLSVDVIFATWDDGTVRCSHVKAGQASASGSKVWPSDLLRRYTASSRACTETQQPPTIDRML